MEKLRYTGPDIIVEDDRDAMLKLSNGMDVMAERKSADVFVIHTVIRQDKNKVFYPIFYNLKEPLYVLSAYLECPDKPENAEDVDALKVREFLEKIQDSYISKKAAEDMMDLIQEDVEKTLDSIRKNPPYPPFPIEGEFKCDQQRKSDFEKVLDEMDDIHVKKDHDYGSSFDELYDECGNLYAYIHLKEKLNRVKTLRKSRQQVKQESLRDSLLDLASYSVMWIVKLDKEKKDEEH